MKTHPIRKNTGVKPTADINLLFLSYLTNRIFVILVLIALFSSVSKGVQALDTAASRPKHITVVTDDNYPPFVFRNHEGKLIGYLVDEWMLWSKKTGIQITLEAVDWSKAQSYLQSGKADVIETIFKTPERERLYSFTPPYEAIEVPVFYHHTLSGITDPTNLQGFTIGVKAGDACIEILKNKGISSFAEYPSYQKVIEAAGNGEIKVFCVDREPAVYFLTKQKLESQFKQAFVLYTGHFHRAVLKNNRKMLEMVNNGFNKITRQEKEALRLKWIGQEIINPLYTRELGIVALIVGILGIFLGVNIIILRTKVRQRTAQLTLANNQLQKSEEKYRELVNHAHESIYVIQNMRVVFVNPASCAATGYTEEQLMGRSVFDFVVPDEQAEAVNILNDLLAGTIPASLKEWEIMTSTGETRLHLINSVRIDWDGLPAVLNFATDITTLRQTDQTLKSERKLLRTLIDHLPDAIYVKDKDGRKIVTNHADVRNTGLTAEQILGKTDQEIFPPETAKTFMADDFKVLRGESVVVNREEFLTNQRNESKWLLTSKLPLTDIQGKITGLIGIGRDITKQKEYETSLLKQNEEYQALNEEYLASNEELNRSLTEIQKINNELRDAKLKAEESDKLKMAFLSNISHEIRTPLNGLIGFSEQITDPDLPSDQRLVFAKLIEESSHRLTAVINDIVDISLLQTRQASLNLQPVSLTELMSNIFTQFTESARQRRLSFTAELPEDPILTFADGKRVGQMVSKLIDNALKFTTSGGVKIGIRRDNFNAIIYVRDTGIGISQAMQEAVFNPFRQADSNQWKSYGGQGLGLSLVRGFTELMGGRIWLTSKEHEGSTFWISLPIKEAFIPQSEPASTLVKKKDAGSITILAAEDELSNFIFLETILLKASYNLLHAHNGQEALDMVKENPNIDLILMDIKMPVMDGYEAFRQIRAVNTSVPVIALTAFAMADEAAKIKNAGFNDYLTKPYKRAELLNIINRWS